MVEYYEAIGLNESFGIFAVTRDMVRKKKMKAMPTIPDLGRITTNSRLPWST